MNISWTELPSKVQDLKKRYQYNRGIGIRISESVIKEYEYQLDGTAKQGPGLAFQGF